MLGLALAWMVSTQPSPTVLLPRLGGFHYAVSTQSKQAQAYFDQGLASIYGFQYPLARQSFQAAAKLDPDCAMAYWGMALAEGPSINWGVDLQDVPDALKAIDQARKAAHATPLERELIEAQATRYDAHETDDRTALDRAYVNAMRGVWSKHPTDPNVGALFADALIDLHPWKQWTLDGKPTEDTPELLTTLRAVLKLDPRNPQALHLSIHALEASPRPSDALFAAERLMDLQPDLAHMQHMPSHIYIKVGMYQKAIDANVKFAGSHGELPETDGLDAAPRTRR